MIGFPMNVLDELKVSFDTHMPEHNIILRPLRYTDPAKSVGIYISDWVPQEDSHQIGQEEPALATYAFRIQNLVKHTNEAEGKAWFAFDAKTIRAVLYRDNDLSLRLRNLVENILGTRETAKRWGVARQRFLSNELKGQFVYLAQTDFWLQTESIEL